VSVVISTAKIKREERCPLGATNEMQLTKAAPRDDCSLSDRPIADARLERRILVDVITPATS